MTNVLALDASTVAVIEAVPLAREVTNPPASTIRTVESDVVHVTTGPSTGASFASNAETLNRAVSPNETKVSVSVLSPTHTAT